MNVFVKSVSSCAIAILFLASCGQNSSVAMAECQSQAYERIGAQSDATATLSWLQTKAESVRVCMLAKGFNYGPDDRSDIRDLDERLSKQYDIWNKADSGNPEVVQARREIQQEVDRAIAIKLTSSTLWSK